MKYELIKGRILEQFNCFLLKPKKTKILIALLVFFFLTLTGTFSFIYYKHLEGQNDQPSDLINENFEENTDTDVQIPSEIDESKEPEDNEEVEDTSDNNISQDSVDDEKPAPISKPKTVPDSEPDPDPEPIPQPEPIPEPVPESPSAIVAFYSDNQSDTEQEDVIHQRTVNNILNSGANPVFHAGDLMEDGTQDSLNRFNTVTATLRSTRTFYAALGNNDRKLNDSSTPSQLFLDNFTFPNNEQWYSVNYGNLHLVVLDSAFSSSNPSQLSWLSSDLQSSNSQTRITGVMFHHPTFGVTIAQQLINYGVDFVVAGHNHAYQHTTPNGINSFVLSGQPSLGHMIVKIYSDKVSIKVYNNGNGLVDSIEFNER